MTDRENDNIEPGPAGCDKAEAIRKRYGLENNEVFEGYDDFAFHKNTNFKIAYLCFEEKELDRIEYKGKIYWINKIE